MEHFILDFGVGVVINYLILIQP